MSKKQNSNLSPKFSVKQEVWSVSQGLETLTYPDKGVVENGLGIVIQVPAESSESETATILFDVNKLQVFVRYDYQSALMYHFMGKWCKVLSVNIVRQNILTVRSMNEDADKKSMVSFPETIWFFGAKVTPASQIETKEFEPLDDSDY